MTGVVASREDRNARLPRQLSRGHLVAQQVEQLGTRPDEGDAGRLASRAKSAFSDRKP